MRMQDYEFWFVVGSQFLYGPEVLETVAARASEMADVLNASGNLPCKLVYKVTAKLIKKLLMLYVKPTMTRTALALSHGATLSAQAKCGSMASLTCKNLIATLPLSIIAKSQMKKSIWTL